MSSGDEFFLLAMSKTFEVDNFQVDGTGMLSNCAITHKLKAAIFDSILEALIIEVPLKLQILIQFAWAHVANNHENESYARFKDMEIDMRSY